MRILLLTLLSVCSLNVLSQVTFWTEDFGSGCDQGQLATSAFTGFGFWTMTSTGLNADTANDWFISAMANGGTEGQCAAVCGDNRTLHVGVLGTALGTDIGAQYYEGSSALCGFFPCGATDKRIESPTINCEGFSDISLSFLYLEGGNAIDNATVWYFDGSSWSQLSDPAKTPVGSCGNTGQWTAYSIALPGSANNNPAVKIGFRWINNDNLEATDPAFAVDNVSLSGEFGADLNPPTIMCPSEGLAFIEENCEAVLPDYIIEAFVMDDSDPFPMIEQFPDPGTMITEMTEVLLVATDLSGNSAECTVIVDVTDVSVPTVICPEPVYLLVEEGATEGTITMDLPVATDNCPGTTWSNDFNNTDNASGTYPEGITEVIFTATDAYGNTATCTTTVEIEVDGIPECCFGDFNCDGVISVADLLILIPQFGCTAGCTTDLDDDGVVAVSDLIIFNGLYGLICP